MHNKVELSALILTDKVLHKHIAAKTVIFETKIMEKRFLTLKIICLILKDFAQWPVKEHFFSFFGRI